MKKRIGFTLVLFVLLLLPVFGMAEDQGQAPDITHWNMTEKRLYLGEEVEWRFVSPNGTYLLNAEERSEDQYVAFELYHVPTHQMRTMEYEISEDEKAHQVLHDIAENVYSRRGSKDIDIVWSADEKYFTFVDYGRFIGNRGINAIVIGDTDRGTIEVPFCWNERIEREKFGIVVNAGFSPDNSALFFTLFNDNLYSPHRMLMLRYDLRTGELIPWCPMQETTADGNSYEFYGRSLIAVSGSVFLTTGSYEGEFVIVRWTDGGWTFEKILGRMSESHHIVDRIQYSAESGMGILQCRMPDAAKSPVVYVFSLSPEGELLSLREVEGDQIYNAVLSPNGRAALLIRRLANPQSYYSAGDVYTMENYFSMLDLETLGTQTVTDPFSKENSDALEDMYFNTTMSEWTNGFCWGGEYLIVPDFDQQVWKLESNIAANVCRNSFYQEPRAPEGSPVGEYQMTKYFYAGEEEPFPEQVEYLTLTFFEDGTVTLVGRAYGDANDQGTWHVEGSILLVDFPSMGMAYVVSDHDEYSRIMLSTAYEWESKSVYGATGEGYMFERK